MFSPKKDNIVLSLSVFWPDLQKNGNMDIVKFELFACLLEREKVHMDPCLSFSDICIWIGADPQEADAFLMEELGYHGDDILKAYRECSALYLESKYGIKL